jgi:formylglycine-generating enzyme required for sulfatase activity
MGREPHDAFPPDDDERPRRIVRLDAFRISRLPVTNRQFHGAGDERPVTYVSRPGAEAFCERSGVRLPTEAEWEAAARGGDDRLWPWGDELPDRSRANFAAGIGGPVPVGSHPAGASPFGALDLAGNVWEWTSGDAVRGGSYLSGADELRCSARLPMHPAARDPYIGFRVVAVEPVPGFDWVDVPAGAYPIGRDGAEHDVVDLPAFELGRTPVTNGQYAAFVAAAGAQAPPHWPAPDDHPVTFVDWFEASAFCSWAGGRLPTEAEWEKAARGTAGRRWPWGDEADATRAAVGAGPKHGATSPVGAHPGGASPYGLQDMAGNVWEWTASAYRPSAVSGLAFTHTDESGNARPDTEHEHGGGEYVLRGGSFASPGLAWARCAMRSRSRPERRQAHIGFRVAR